jgi:hypothetical protein
MFFSRGQLHVACSSIGSAKGLHILVLTGKTANVLFKKCVLNFHHNVITTWLSLEDEEGMLHYNFMLSEQQLMLIFSYVKHHH